MEAAGDFAGGAYLPRRHTTISVDSAAIEQAMASIGRRRIIDYIACVNARDERNLILPRHAETLGHRKCLVPAMPSSK